MGIFEKWTMSRKFILIVPCESTNRLCVVVVFLDPAMKPAQQESVNNAKSENGNVLWKIVPKTSFENVLNKVTLPKSLFDLWLSACDPEKLVNSCILRHLER